MTAISDAGEMLKIIDDKNAMEVKIEMAQENGNKSEKRKCEKELAEISNAAKILAVRIG